VHYEIDLNKKNARAFRKKLALFIEHARKAGPGQRRGPARTASSRQRSADIRAWAKATGLPVSDRGRIPASVADQYEAATRRYLRTPRHRRNEPIRSGGPWPRAAGQQRATGPSRLPAHSRIECVGHICNARHLWVANTGDTDHISTSGTSIFYFPSVLLLVVISQ
jgi:hypothetical protein